MIPAYASAAALLFVACVMARGLAEMDWDDITEYAPAVVAAIAMPLTYSIATGIGLGFITYALVKILAGQARRSQARGDGAGGDVRGEVLISADCPKAGTGPSAQAVMAAALKRGETGVSRLRSVDHARCIASRPGA